MNDADNKTPPTENKDEREHCEQAVDGWSFWSQEAWQIDEELVDLLISERAAADKAAYERGRAEAHHEAYLRGVTHSFDLLQSKYDIACKELDAAIDSATEAGTEMLHYKHELNALQSQHKRLTAAARAVRKIIAFAVEHEPVVDAFDAALAETLPETEEKKT